MKGIIFSNIMLLSAILFSGLFFNVNADENPLTGKKTFGNNAEYTIGFGAGVTRLNDYIGSDESSIYAFPMPFIYYKDDNVKLDRNVLEGEVFSNKKWHFTIGAAGSVPVKNNKARIGMPDLDWVGEIGPSLEYYLSGDNQAINNLYIDFSVRKAIATDFTYLNHIGFVSQLGLNKKHTPTEKILGGHLVVNMAAALLYNSSEYANYYYGVASEFKMQNRDEYIPKSGYAGFRLAIGATWRKNNIWFGIFSRYNNINNTKFVSSPLVKQNNNLLIGFAMAYIFLEN